MTNCLVDDKEHVLKRIDELRQDVVDGKWGHLALIGVSADYQTGVNFIVGNAYGAAAMIQMVSQNVHCNCPNPMCDTALFKAIMETISAKFLNDEPLGQMVVSGFTAPATPQTKN